MTTTCLCYTCDRNYLLPSLVSSLQARQNLSRDVADIAVLVVGGFEDRTGEISRLFAENAIIVEQVDRRTINNLPIHYARHFLDTILDQRYERIFHVDSDTQVSGDLNELLLADIPSGNILAAPDPMALRIHENARRFKEHKAYFRQVGMPDRQLDRYVNTGIFGGMRNDLSYIGRECLLLCAKQERPFRYVEQDAVNIAFGDQIRHISLRWNFPSFFLNFGFDKFVTPRICHFMSNPRPWQGIFSPWDRQTYEIYTSAVLETPQLSPYLPSVSAQKKIKYHLQQYLKRVVEPWSWNTADVRSRLFALEQNAIV